MLHPGIYIFPFLNYIALLGFNVGETHTFIVLYKNLKKNSFVSKI
jgi:hypothetical protein